MTLILSAYANGWSFQVSDRRLALLDGLGGRQPVYEFANKSLILRTADAVVTVGFTGLAHIQDTPTDQWILDRLVRTLEDSDGHRHRGLGPRRLHQVVAQLRKDVTAGLATSVLPGRQEFLVRLVFAGQRWDRGSPRAFSPISFDMEFRRMRGLTVPTVSSHGFRRKWFRGIDPQAVFSTNPPRTLEYWLNEQIRSGAPRTRDGFRQFLVAALRRMADSSGGAIGHDCMLVELLPYRDGWTRAWVEFFPASSPMPFLQAGGRDFPLTFTPAVLTTRSYVKSGVQNMDVIIPPVELNVVGLEGQTGLPVAGYRDDLATPTLSELIAKRPRLPRHWLPPTP